MLYAAWQPTANGAGASKARPAAQGQRISNSSAALG